MAASPKKLLSIAAGVASFMLAYAGVQHFFFSAPVFDKAMLEVASELNASCPMMVDSETRLDNVMAAPDTGFQYFYTLVNMEKASIDLEGARSFLTPQIVNNIKTNPEMEFLRKHETTFKYTYKDKDGNWLLTIVVTPDMYK